MEIANDVKRAKSVHEKEGDGTRRQDKKIRRFPGRWYYLGQTGEQRRVKCPASRAFAETPSKRQENNGEQ